MAGRFRLANAEAKRSRFHMPMAMKMYILIRESIPTGFALVAAAHGSLAAYLKFAETDEVRRWLSGPFYKTICKVTEEQFAAAKAACADHIVITESALGGAEVALAFKPRDEWPKAFKFFPLYRE
jgi:hypothetical protein